MVCQMLLVRHMVHLFGNYVLKLLSKYLLLYATFVYNTISKIYDNINRALMLHNLGVSNSE